MAGSPLTDDDIERLYRERGHVVLRRAGQLLGNEEEAHEIVQEIFAGLLADRDQFAGASSVTTWLYSVTTHLCLNRLRDWRTRQRLLAANGGLGSGFGDARAGLEVAASRATVRAFLGRVPAPLAQIAVYHYVDEMSHEEIGRVLGCSRRQVGRLVEDLQSWMEKERAS
jgi:RNA polymerase sigma factor (sigma-70 family)